MVISSAFERCWLLSQGIFMIMGDEIASLLKCTLTSSCVFQLTDSVCTLVHIGGAIGTVTIFIGTVTILSGHWKFKQ